MSLCKLQIACKILKQFVGTNLKTHSCTRTHLAYVVLIARYRMTSTWRSQVCVKDGGIESEVIPAAFDKVAE